MTKLTPIAEPAGRPARGAWLWVALALVVLAGTVVWSQLDLRHRIREQIAGRDGQILDAVAAMQHLDDQTSGETLATLADAGEQMQLALKVSRLRNVIGVRLFDASGQFLNSFPATILEATLTADDIARLRALQPVSRYEPRAHLEKYELLSDANDPTTPLLLVAVPLRSEDGKKLVGVAQFLMDGSGIAKQFAALDRRLLGQSLIGFLVGAMILSAGLGLAFHRVQKANRQLARRSADLVHANRELALAARISAVGAVTSHLIHGLRNPLSGLALFMQNQTANGPADGEEWQLALKSMQRMQAMIDRIVGVLREQQTGAEYQISAVEIGGLAKTKFLPAARAAGVDLEISLTAKQTFSNRVADLILLVLENLMQNAIDATACGRRVQLRISEGDNVVIFEVQDEGAGLPADRAEKLFTPGISSKNGGSGIGLAISKQLADHLGARLELAANAPTGCVFRLTVPKISGSEPMTSEHS